jgi:hypothetical protein
MMNTTDLPSQIRECVDEGTSPVTPGEVRARAVVTGPRVRRVPGGHRTRLTVAATGVAAAGLAGALVASQTGGGAPAGTRTVLTAAVLRHVAGASRAAMTSGRADITWTSAGTTVIQHIAFDGANWEDTLPPRGPGQVASSSPSGLHVLTWSGQTIEKVVDGQDYHYPAFAWKPKPHLVAGWMHIIAPGAGAPLNIPDPRTLLSVLSPSAGFVTDGYTTVNGIRVERLRATTPAAVPVAPLDQIIQSEPNDPRFSALELSIDSSDVVLQAQFTVTGSDAISKLTPAGVRTVQQYVVAHRIRFLGQVDFRAAYEALIKSHPGLAMRLRQRGMVATEHVQDPGVTVAVTFSQVGQPQAITAPASYTTVGGKG